MGDQAVLLSESVVEMIRRRAAVAHPIETGGILVGVSVGTRIWITGAVEIPSRTRGPAHYEIPARATRVAVRAARARDPRVGYVGDWHSHPLLIHASSVDLSTARRVSRQMRRPALSLIAMRRGQGYDFDLTMARGRQTTNVSIVAAGDLPRTDLSGNSDDSAF